MEDASITAEFVLRNFDKILKMAREVYGGIDETLRTKLRTGYTKYLEHTYSRYSKGKSFFSRNEPINLYEYYVHIGLRCETQTIKKPYPKTCFNRTKRIVITGSGGSGKSMLMRHLFLCSIHDKEHIPVFVELRDLNIHDRELQELIEDIFKQYSFDESWLFFERTMKEGHFALFLDGYDEVYPERRSDLIREIGRMSRKYPRCPIVLATRPDDDVRSLDEFSVFRITPLSLNGALDLISKLQYDREIRDNFCNDLKLGLFKKHRSFLSNPLLLGIMLLTYGENSEIPTRESVFFSLAYEALFHRHDASKGGFRRKRETSLDINEFARVFALFCLQTYEKRLFKMSRIQALHFVEKARDNLGFEFSADVFLNDSLSAVCLLAEDGLEIMFTHRTFQEYFVAYYIVSTSDEIQRSLLCRYWRFSISDKVIYIVTELNPEIVERNLLIPKMTELFERLKTKKSVGISHAERYMKMVYSHIGMNGETIVATIRDPGYPIEQLLNIAIDICKNYSPPGKEYFAMQAELFRDKYGKYNPDELEDTFSYETSNMSYRTPMLREILEGEGIFSLNYLRACHRALGLLRKKHRERLQSLDRLLGL